MGGAGLEARGARLAAASLGQSLEAPSHAPALVVPGDDHVLGDLAPGDGVAALLEVLEGPAHPIPFLGPAVPSPAQPPEHRRDDGGTHEDRQGACEEGQPERGGDRRALGAHLLHDAEQLQAHDQEDEALEDELDGVPGLRPGDAVVRRQEPGRAMTGHQARDDGRHEPAAAHVLGGDGGEERHGEGDDRVDAGVGDAGAQVQGELADHPPDDEGDDDGERETAQDLPRARAPGHGRRDRGGQDHEGGGVVEEPLALQHGDDALGDPQAPGDGDRHTRLCGPREAEWGQKQDRRGAPCLRRRGANADPLQEGGGEA